MSWARMWRQSRGDRQRLRPVEDEGASTPCTALHHLLVAAEFDELAGAREEAAAGVAAIGHASSGDDRFGEFREITAVHFQLQFCFVWREISAVRAAQ